MVLALTSFEVGVDDCKIYPVTADTTASYTCGTVIELTGIKTVKFDPNIESQELTGDNIIMDSWSKVIGGTFELTFAKCDLSSMALALGAQIVAAGTTPNQTQTLSLLSGSQCAYFQITAVINGTDTASAITGARITLFKCKIDGASIVDNTERGVSTFSLKGKCSYTLKAFTRNAITTQGILCEKVFYETVPSIVAVVA